MTCKDLQKVDELSAAFLAELERRRPGATWTVNDTTAKIFAEIALKRLKAEGEPAPSDQSDVVRLMVEHDGGVANF